MARPPRIVKARAGSPNRPGRERRRVCLEDLRVELSRQSLARSRCTKPLRSAGGLRSGEPARVENNRREPWGSLRRVDLRRLRCDHRRMRCRRRERGLHEEIRRRGQPCSVRSVALEPPGSSPCPRPSQPGRRSPLPAEPGLPSAGAIPTADPERETTEAAMDGGPLTCWG